MKWKTLNLAFWIALIGFTMNFLLVFFSGIKISSVYLILGTYFSGLLLYIGLFIGFEILGKILKNKLLFYSSFVFVFLVIFHIFFLLLSLNFIEVRIHPWTSIFEYLALIIFSFGLFSLRHKFKIFAPLSALFLASNCFIKLFAFIFSLPLPFIFFSFTRFLAYIFALIILFEAKKFEVEK
ncbi:MAG: hypothetical protein QXP77_00290 [Candidatus Aenigmatarchaeota archaeon]